MVSEYGSLQHHVLYPDELSQKKAEKYKERVVNGSRSIPPLIRSRASLYGVYMLNNKEEIQEIKLHNLIQRLEKDEKDNEKFHFLFNQSKKENQKLTHENWNLKLSIKKLEKDA